MTISRLGGFEEMVLLAVAALRGDGYGIALQEFLEAEVTGRVSIGAVYATLDRLQRKGLVRSREGEPTAERGGRRRRHYVVSAAGLKALRSARDVRASLWDHVPDPTEA